jgi:hypothetical protein
MLVLIENVIPFLCSLQEKIFPRAQCLIDLALRCGVSALSRQPAIVMATATSAGINPERIQSKIAHFKAAILGPDPKIGSSDDRSLTGTAHLFPTVPACSTGWLIRHDRLDR